MASNVSGTGLRRGRADVHVQGHNVHSVSRGAAPIPEQGKRISARSSGPSRWDSKAVGDSEKPGGNGPAEHAAASLNRMKHRRSCGARGSSTCNLCAKAHKSHAIGRSSGSGQTGPAFPTEAKSLRKDHPARSVAFLDPHSSPYGGASAVEFHHTSLFSPQFQIAASTNYNFSIPELPALSSNSGTSLEAERKNVRKYLIVLKLRKSANFTARALASIKLSHKIQKFEQINLPRGTTSLPKPTGLKNKRPRLSTSRASEELEKRSCQA